MFSFGHKQSSFEQPPSYVDTMAARSYYFIKNQQNGLFVTLQGNVLRPSGVIATTQQPEGRNDSQLWYDDPLTGTIRSKANNLCLDVEGERVILSNHQPGSSTQMWERCGSIVRRRTTPTIVLAIGKSSRNSRHNHGASAGANSPVVAQVTTGAWPQLFDFIYWYPSQPAAPAYGFAPPCVPASPSVAEVNASLKARRFYIVSEMNGKVLDIRGGSPNLNTPVIMWDRKPTPEANQLWYFDSQGFIYSALNDFVFQSTGPGGLKMGPNLNDPKHQWSLHGNRILNRCGECLDIMGENKKAGAELCSYGYKGSSNQHWRIQYV